MADDLRRQNPFIQNSVTDTVNQDAVVWETDAFRLYTLDNIAVFKNMIAYAIRNDIYDARAFDMGTIVF